MKRLLYLLCLASLFACKKETNTPAEKKENDPASPVNVLIANAGFTHVFDDVQFLSSANAASPSMGVADFTVDASHQLHLAYYSMQPSQQDPRYQFKRISKNLNTGQLVTLPQYSDDLSTYSYTALGQRSRAVVLEAFKPYHNFFTYATYYRQQFSNGVDYYGDISFTISHANPLGIPDMAYYYPALNMDIVTPNNNGFSYFTLGVPNPTHLLSVCNPISFTANNKSGKPYLKTLLEPRFAAQGNTMAFRATMDSLLAYQVDINNVAKQVLLAKVSLSGMNPANEIITLRHYSLDGKKLGMLFKDKVTAKYWTISYDFSTNQLTKGLNNVSLDYSGPGSDIDLDEEGNIYYTGIAGKGINANGVSIYKLDVQAGASLVGADNLLKFGEVIKLKILLGKVYIVIKGKQTGTSYYQLSVLQQD